MNYLNPFLKINMIVYIITLSLFFTLYLGMLFQIILGITQILTAFYVTYNFYKALDSINQKRIIAYWITITINLTLVLFTSNFWDIQGAIFLFFIPMIIASLFLKLLSIITKEINHL